MARQRSIKLLSIIIPAYKQEKTIISDVTGIEKALDVLGIAYEIIIVVDGMVDQTFQNAQQLKSTNIKVFGSQQNHGKGYAVRYGMKRAKGSIIGFIDSGMDINPQGLSMLLNHMDWYNADVIVGSKLHPVSKVHYPFSRRVLSWGYRFLTRLLFGFKIRDTQVGLKFFKRQVITDVLPCLIVNTYAFDIEILALAYQLGYKRIYEAPVDITFNNSSSITSKTLWSTIFQMLWDTFTVFYRIKIRHSYKNKVPQSVDEQAERDYAVSVSS